MIDLTEALYIQRSKPRGDELLPHVSDLWGCDRATWYRRQDMRPTPFSPETLARFAIGRGYEMTVAQDLKDGGYGISTDVDMTVCGLLGHADIVISMPNREHRPTGVVEVKTTSLRNPKPYVAPQYAIQVAAYAIGLGLDEGAVFVYHKGSDQERQYRVVVDGLATDPDGAGFGAKSQWAGYTWRQIIEERAQEVLATTGPDAETPPANPGELSPWGCRYCDWHQCERNPRYDPAGEIPL
jgi:hypothetical protein